MRPLPPAEHDGLESARITFEWPHATIAQRYRLLQTTPSPRFWASDWRFYADGAPTSPPRRPRAARRRQPPALHRFRAPARAAAAPRPCTWRRRARRTREAGTGCVKARGGPVLRATLPRAGVRGGQCWLEADFGAAIHIQCMAYLVSAARSGEAPALQIWDERRRRGSIRASAHSAPPPPSSSTRRRLAGACCRLPPPPPRRCRPAAPLRPRPREQPPGCSSRPVGVHWSSRTT